MCAWDSTSLFSLQMYLFFCFRGSFAWKLGTVVSWTGPCRDPRSTGRIHCFRGSHSAARPPAQLGTYTYNVVSSPELFWTVRALKEWSTTRAYLDLLMITSAPEYSAALT